MEVDERPTEQYGDIGGLDKQIQEVQLLSISLSIWLAGIMFSPILFCPSLLAE